MNKQKLSPPPHLSEAMSSWWADTILCQRGTLYPIGAAFRFGTGHSSAARGA
jgi:hypothetical protein